MVQRFKTSPSSTGGVGSISGEIKSTGCMVKTPEHKHQKQHCNKFSEDFKMVHIKKKKTLKKKSLKKYKSDPVIPLTSNYSMPSHCSQEDKVLPRTYHPLNNLATTSLPILTPPLATPHTLARITIQVSWPETSGPSTVPRWLSLFFCSTSSQT